MAWRLVRWHHHLSKSGGDAIEPRNGGHGAGADAGLRGWVWRLPRSQRRQRLQQRTVVVSEKATSLQPVTVSAVSFLYIDGISQKLYRWNAHNKSFLMVQLL